MNVTFLHLKPQCVFSCVLVIFSGWSQFFCRLINLEFFYPVNNIKKYFSVTVQTSSFSWCFGVFLLLNLLWFWSSKCQNNCSHISRWTLTGLKQLSFTWFFINHFLEKSVPSQIWTSGSFEERLFPEALLSLFLSGGMIFTSLQNISHTLPSKSLETP